MKTPVSILFWFRRDGRKSKGVAVAPEEIGSIYCRITTRGKELNFSANLPALRYGEWDSKAQRVAGRKPEAVMANQALTKMRNDLTDFWADLERQGKQVTASKLKALYKNNGAALSLPELFAAFIEERKALVGIEISANTLVVAEVRYNKLQAYLAHRKAPDMRPEDFTHNEADKFIYWLLKDEGFERITANKYVQVVSQVLTWGVRREHLDKNPLALYKYKRVEAREIKYLTKVEIQVLTEAAMPTDCLDHVRDCFLFQCWTGLAYADLAALDLASALEAHAGTGRQVLRVRRQKSTIFKGYECVIPLLPETQRLLLKYDGALPVPSNQKYNAYLKQVGEICNIAPDKMTSHVGRKTAGVLLLNAGIRMEVVSKFLGHSSIKQTEKVYAKILDTTIVDDFERVFGAALLPGPARQLPAAAMLPTSNPRIFEIRR